MPKLYAIMLNMKLDERAEAAALRAPTQCGFRKDHRVEDNCCILKTVLERCKKVKGGCACLFVDLA